MTESCRGVLVYCPLEGRTLPPVARELLGEGARLAALLGEELWAAVTGPAPAAVEAEAGTLGARRVYCVHDPALLHYTAEGYAGAMEAILRAARPSIVLVGATVEGRDMAARLAARMGTGLTADCTELDIDPQTGLLLQTRPAYGGNVKATIICAGSRPQMATVRPGVFPLPASKSAAPAAELITLPLPAAVLSCRARVLDAQALPAEEDILAKARVVVAYGQGARNSGGIALAEQLAQALGGVVGASRGAVENGLAPRSRQVGQTGRTIRPELYIACGISGAVQHLEGMRQAGCIIAVNSDPDAPIFHEADYGICGDLFEVLPKLTRLAAAHIKEA